MNNESDKTFIKWLLYILSLWLLFVSLSIMSFDSSIIENISNSDLRTKNYVFIASVSFIVIGFIILLILKNSFSSSGSVYCQVSNVSNETHEHLEFLTTYIMPLVFTDINSKRTMLNLAVMIVFIGVIYVKTNRFYANPSLAILGFKLYKLTIIDSSGEKTVVAISRDHLKNGSIIKYIKIDDDTFFLKAKRQSN